MLNKGKSTRVQTKVKIQMKKILIQHIESTYKKMEFKILFYRYVQIWVVSILFMLA
mgnify:CR=1 FL=1